MTLYCATGNQGKLREFELAAQAAGLDVKTVPNLKSIPAPDETGVTFEENAILKALYYSAHAPDAVFADDSGLEVDALGGRPGVRSARFAKEDATSAENIAALLTALENVEDDQRTARFRCVISRTTNCAAGASR